MKDPVIDPTVVGYARVSTRDQDLDAQIAALREAGGRVLRSKWRVSDELDFVRTEVL